MKKNVDKNHKNKVDKKDISINGNVSKPKVSSNWFTFIKSDNKILKKAVKDEKRVCHFRNFKNSEGMNKHKITKVLALDCEMVSDMEDQDMIGRVSIVNYNLECIYDKFVKPSSPVGDYRTRFSGLREADLEKGVEFDVVQREVKALLHNKILVGHALKNDFKVLKFGHFQKFIRDTSKFGKFHEISNGKTPSLKTLAKSFLGENIQEGEHSSVEDAKTAMKLYIKYRREWEVSILNGKTESKGLPHRMKHTESNIF